MDCCYSYAKPRFCFQVLPSVPPRRHITFGQRRPLIVVSSTSGSSTSKCEFGGLNAPLEPRSQAGRFLTGVLLDDRDNFQAAAQKQLQRLAAERDEAVARLQLSFGSNEACLHRRIAEMRRHECQVAVEDVMYMLILYNFSEMRVHLVPRLSKCVCNGRLEIWPSKDWELESIHSFELLEMVREHLNTIVGWRANSNVTDSWAITKIQLCRLFKLYASSILYGYFLKSASLRHNLECSLDPRNSTLRHGARSQLTASDIFSFGHENIPLGQVSNQKSSSVSQLSCGLVRKQGNLRHYLMRFDPETVQMCAKPKSKEAVNLIERHSCALFGDDDVCLLESNETISTSFASLKRFALEAIALGSFLRETEKSVNDVYMLEDN